MDRALFVLLLLTCTTAGLLSVFYGCGSGRNGSYYILSVLILLKKLFFGNEFDCIYIACIY